MKNIKSVLEGIYSNPELRKKIVPLFIGNPGLGKTAIIEQFAKEKGVKLVELITSQMSPFEISGICIPDKDTKQMMYYNLDKLETLKDGDILFFDELLNGNPIVLNACLTILEQRRFISGKALPDILIVAAANTQGMVPLTPQIKRRFVWYPVKFDKDMWVEYMTNEYSITKNIGDKMSKLIVDEDFTNNNFNTPADLDKAVAMLLKDIYTPYEDHILPILSENIENKLTEEVDLGNGEILMPNQMMSWIELIRFKKGIVIKNPKKNNIEEDAIEQLPKKWCVEVTLENFNEINSYFRNIVKSTWRKEIGWALSEPNSNNYWGAHRFGVPGGFDLISIEQFRKHILKK